MTVSGVRGETTYDDARRAWRDAKERHDMAAHSIAGLVLRGAQPDPSLLVEYEAARLAEVTAWATYLGEPS